MISREKLAFRKACHRIADKACPPSWEDFSMHQRSDEAVGYAKALADIAEGRLTWPPHPAVRCTLEQSEKFYSVQCKDCKWSGCSCDTAGGEPTGGDDFEDIRCPVCDGEVDEVDGAAAMDAASIVSEIMDRHDVDCPLETQVVRNEVNMTLLSHFASERMVQEYFDDLKDESEHAEPLRELKNRSYR